MILQVGVKALIQNAEGKFLVLARNFANYADINKKDAWDIPGGRINPGTPLIENLAREIMEETGLTLTTKPKLICAQDILRGEDKHVVRLTYFVGKLDGKVVLDTKEHSAFKWLSAGEIKASDDIDQYLREAVDFLPATISL
jgi:8-oxo-dGTP pyrophosphatase MutT (NUDIX family)